MEKFEITLKNEKLKSYLRITWIIIFIHVVVYIFLAFSTNRFISSTAISGLILLTVLFILRFLTRNENWRPGPHTFFLFLGVGWICLHIYWLALIPFIFDFLYTAASAKLVARFSSVGIIYPSFPLKKIAWNSLTNIILKDGWLTIDFKNNRIIQQQVDESVCNIDEKIFNDFCIRQLNP